MGCDAKWSWHNRLPLRAGNVDNMFLHRCERSEEETGDSSRSLWTGWFVAVDNRV